MIIIRHWNGQAKNGAAGFALPGQVAAMGEGDLACGGEAETDAFGFAGRKGFEEARDDVSGRTWAGIADLDGAGARFLAERGLDPAAGARGGHGVIKQIDQHLAELTTVGPED